MTGRGSDTVRGGALGRGLGGGAGAPGLGRGWQCRLEAGLGGARGAQGWGWVPGRGLTLSAEGGP